MKLDLVHDIQAAYRLLLDSMSRPGVISDLGDQAVHADMGIGSYPSTIVLALMLLDTEVTFKVFSRHEAEVEKRIHQLTYAKSVEVERADYIFVLKDALEEQLESALHAAKTGDLVNPHESATIIIEADEVSNGNELVLTGPGIRHESRIEVKTSANWMNIREMKNAEYPMGIDLIFTDSGHRLLALPRTTQIVKRGK